MLELSFGESWAHLSQNGLFRLIISDVNPTSIKASETIK